MNIDKINNSLVKAINHFQMAEIQEQDDVIDELSGDSGGPEALHGFVEHIIVNALGKVEATDDEVIDAMFEIAEAAVESGKLPEIPDAETVDEDEWTGWVEKANEAGLADATVSLIKKRAAA